MNPSAPYRPPGTLSLTAALQPYTGPWNRRLAAHLLRRAGFGGSVEDVTRLAGASMRGAVDSLLHFPPTDGLPSAPSDLPGDDELYPRLRAAGGGSLNGFRPRLGLPVGGVSAPMSVPNGQAMQAQPAADDAQLQQIRMQSAEARRQANLVLATWWLERMLRTSAPLQEKMTLFWHGHFTTAALTKGITPREALDQNWLFRSHALGNVRELTMAVSRDPAMLRYLDNAASGKAHPNENYARELMELFTLGIGNYTERDVRESARAFTGWSVRRGEGFYFNAGQHDAGSKTFLGRSGNFDGADIVNIIFQQPPAPRWFARKLVDFFVYNDPEPELVDAVAGLIEKSDFNLQPVLSTLFRSNVFYSERAYRALVKSPTEFVLGTYQLFGIDSVAPETLGALNRMGQVVFHPPSVKGWDGGLAWLNSQTMLTRENFASALMSSQQKMRGDWLTGTMPTNAQSAAQLLVSRILQGDASPASMARLESYLDGSETSALGKLSGENFEERMRGAAYLTMAMPAYQLC